MLLSLIAFAAAGFVTDSVVLEERIDLFDPSTSAFLGSERTWFGRDGRRLRLVITDADGTRTLLFVVRHDDRGREVEAIYTENGLEPDREVFTYSEDGRLRTTTYLSESGEPASRTESVLDTLGREILKRYYRADGSQYGEEDVLWNPEGDQAGWEFRYLDREGGASFRYSYEDRAPDGGWARRVRSRDGVAQRVEVRTLVKAVTGNVYLTPAPFAPGRVSTGRSETSPSFSQDGKTMVFARYDDDWTRKEPFIAYLEADSWRVESLRGELGDVYNLAIAPDAASVIYAVRTDSVTTLHRIRRQSGLWSAPEDLSARYGLTGTYPCLTVDGDLFLYRADGASGSGIYLARRVGDGFRAAQPVFVPPSGTTFDVFATHAEGPLLVSRCFDDACRSGPENGIWEVALPESGAPQPRKLPVLPYGWGVQPVEALGVFAFTDGDEILTVPLAAAGISR